MSYIQVTDLTFAYEGSYDNIFEDVSFRLDTDWKLGLIGRNGARYILKVISTISAPTSTGSLPLVGAGGKNEKRRQANPQRCRCKGG